MKNILLGLTLLFIAAGATAQTPQSIASVKSEFTINKVYTVAGRVTVANEFGGPIYLQDGTGGIAVFDTRFHAQVAPGDSIVVTGPLVEFQARTGQPGTGLAQLSGTGLTLQIIQTPRVLVAPRVVTISQINENLEGQLVQVRNATLRTTANATVGTFQGNTNYRLTDATGNVELRIDGDANLVGSNAPAGETTVTAVVSEFQGTRQILPRTRDDIGGVVEFVIPFENRPRSETFEVCTWNIEWLGDPANGPTNSGPNDITQIANAATVIRRIDADIYALQEISSDAAFRQLLDSVRGNGYAGFRVPTGQTQRLAFLWKTATVDSLGFRTIADSGNWSQFQGLRRFPAELTINARIGAVTRRLRVINIHADAGSAIADYNRRVSDAGFLKRQIDRELRNEAVILLGDYNDDVDVSITTGQPTPYANFISDAANYRIVTGFLSARGIQSFSGTGGQMIDHIAISRQLFPAHLDSTQRVENTVYIPNYVSTTSDHFPVWTRFDLTRVASTRIENAPQPTAYRLLQNYPNPFNPTTSIRYNIPTSGFVSLKVYDLLGREVRALVGERQAAGSYESRFDASALPSGMYFYRLQSGAFSETKKMLLVK